jgi:hypothetical protein
VLLCVLCVASCTLCFLTRAPYTWEQCTRACAKSLALGSDQLSCTRLHSPTSMALEIPVGDTVRGAQLEYALALCVWCVQATLWVCRAAGPSRSCSVATTRCSSWISRVRCLTVPMAPLSLLTLHTSAHMSSLVLMLMLIVVRILVAMFIPLDDYVVSFCTHVCVVGNGIGNAGAHKIGVALGTAKALTSLNLSGTTVPSHLHRPSCSHKHAYPPILRVLCILSP